MTGFMKTGDGRQGVEGKRELLNKGNEKKQSDYWDCFFITSTQTI